MLLPLWLCWNTDLKCVMFVKKKKNVDQMSVSSAVKLKPPLRNWGLMFDSPVHLQYHFHKLSDLLHSSCF